MDRSTGSTDAFVEIRFAGREEQTNIARKTLHPKWEQDFRFDVADDAVIQEPLILRVSTPCRVLRALRSELTSVLRTQWTTTRTHRLI